MILLFAILAILMILTVPIANTLALSSLTLIWDMDIPTEVVGQRLFSALDSFPLLAIPFFILAGIIMEQGGISKRIVNFANTFVGSSYGGLAVVTVIACMFFGAVSGSGSATTAAVGTIMIPAMVKKGYNINFAASTTAAGAILGVIIPPSIAMILYAVGSGTSIGELFMAGILPGILIGISLIFFVKYISKKHNYGGDNIKYSWSDRFKAFKEAIFALLMPIIILGGIYGGMFTATEAAVVACFYALIIGLFIYKGWIV